jgi:CheY-like chemotaxis protein
MSKSEPIIIVEDDLDDQQLIQEVYASLKIGHKLLCFANGKEVLDYLQSGHDNPFLIICDINMPEMGGIRLREIINKDDRLRKKSIPFVFLSTTADQSEVNQAYDMTVQGFFEKGNNYEKLKRRLEIIFEYWKECVHPNSFARA